MIACTGPEKKREGEKTDRAWEGGRQGREEGRTDRQKEKRI